jgi:hypothetical protein
VKHSTPGPGIILAGSKKGKNAITIRHYSDMLKERDRTRIAQLIQLRFRERYLDPALDNPKRHGFAMLAVCCLMVEALESFRNGWKGTQGIKGGCEAAFRSFFEAHDQFKDLRPVASEFFKHVRCGILHQAETTGQWTVNRSSELFSSIDGQRRVSASEFGKRLRAVLNEYTDGLAQADWRDAAWTNARRKLRSICRNCGLPEEDVKRLQ